MATLRSALSTVTTFLQYLLSKKVLVFIFFLILSSLMWMMISFNEEMEKELLVPIQITNVPKNVVVTSDVNDTLRLTLRDKGYTLAKYFYGKGVKPISINFQQYARSNGMFTISNADLLRMVKQQLSPSTHILSVKPERLEVFFNHGNHKVVPIRLQGNLVPSASYMLTHTRLIPDKVTVYAADGLLDSITAVYTEPLNRTDISDSARYEVRLQTIRGAKIVPQKVYVDVMAELLTERTLEVPISVVNVPEDKHLRLFPSTAKVKFVVGTSRYATAKEGDFQIVADYNDVVNTEGDKVRIRLRHKPAYARQAKTDINEVSFLIEER